jgi:hypothetical protein
MRAAVPTLLLVLALLSCTRDTTRDLVPGVRLGMSPRDVRDRFDGGGPGGWQTKVGGGPGATDDTVLEWTATSDATRATSARFEFHLGMLVAVRTHLREPAGAEHIDLTPKTVSVRTPQGGGSDVTILARDCPTHHEEAESLASKAH